MSVSLRSFASFRLAAVAGVWMCGSGAALAGGSGGADQPGLQSTLDNICVAVGLTPSSTPGSVCPKLPTLSQLVAEISGLINSAPDDVRSLYFQDCGNLLFPGAPCSQLAVSAANPPVKSPPPGLLELSSLTPLAFKPGAAVTLYGDPAAKRFLYAAVVEGSNGQPQFLDLVLDDTLDNNKQFSQGRVVAFSLPLVVLNSGGETLTPATLQLTATCNGAANCLTGTVTGVLGPGKTPPSAAQLGIQFTSTFDSSPNSTAAHRIYGLQLPMIATPDNDPTYFNNPPSCPNGNGANLFSGYCNAFSTKSPGFSAAVLGGASIGVAPYAAPLCTATTCPANPTSTPTTYFGLCASFAAESAVATFLQIGTDGKTTIVTPVNTQGIQCPPQS
jgi:hypothetical protein